MYIDNLFLDFLGQPEAIKYCFGATNIQYNHNLGFHQENLEIQHNDQQWTKPAWFKT